MAIHLIIYVIYAALGLLGIGAVIAIAYLSWPSIRSWWDNWKNNNLTTQDAGWIGMVIQDKKSNGKYNYIAAGYNESTKEVKNIQRIEADNVAPELSGRKVIEVRR